MYIFGLLFIIFVNFSAFSMVTPLDSTEIPSQTSLSCTPPEAESSLVNSPATSSMATVIVTVSQSSPPAARKFNSLEELTFKKEKIMPRRNSRDELALDRVSEEEAIRLKIIVAQEETAIYFDWPGARRVRTSPLAFAWAQRHNDSYCPSEAR